MKILYCDPTLIIRVRQLNKPNYERVCKAESYQRDPEHLSRIKLTINNNLYCCIKGLLGVSNRTKIIQFLYLHLTSYITRPDCSDFNTIRLLAKIG